LCGAVSNFSFEENVMTFNSEIELCNWLETSSEYGRYYVAAKNLPLPFFCHLSEVRAIVLGTDPSNQQTNALKQVFGLEEPQSVYFASFRSNLAILMLTDSQIYVQNLCKNYFKDGSEQNPCWLAVAELWTPLLKRELDSILPSNIPVLLTAQKLLQALTTNEHLHVVPAQEIYSRRLLVEPHESKLGRLLVPMFRHYQYNLSQWPHYAELIRSCIEPVGTGT
jgi:hypothetical protein